MDNISENNFDDLFRESSEKVDFEYREDAWTALDGMLEEKEKKRRWLWIWTGLALSSILIISLFYFSKNVLTDSTDNRTEQNTAITSGTPVAESEVINPTFEQIEKETTVEQKAKTETPKSVSNQNYSDRQPLNPTSKQPIFQSKNTDISTFKAINKNTSVVTEKNSETKSTETNTFNNSDTTRLEAVQTEPIATLLNPISIPNKIHKFETNISTLPFVLVKQNVFSFGAFGSLNYNSLSLAQEKAQQGYRLGLRTDYNFARHFSIGLGVAFSRKTYTASGTRYNAKPGFWTDGIAPIELDGFCNIIEIPLELRYYAKGYDNDGFFFGAGLNSYHFSLEQYDFRYDEVVPGAILDWEERGTNTHFLAVGAFTVGYQKKLSSKLALQIAPYFNLPLKGIGQGGVSLQSAGINLGFNWR